MQFSLSALRLFFTSRVVLVISKYFATREKEIAAFINKYKLIASVSFSSCSTEREFFRRVLVDGFSQFFQF